MKLKDILNENNGYNKLRKHGLIPYNYVPHSFAPSTNSLNKEEFNKNVR